MLKKRIIETVEWKEKNKAVGGYLLSVTRNKYRDGSVGLTYVVKRTDESRAVFKGATNLNLALGPSDIGKFIQVVYLGEDETREAREGMNRPKLFEVSVDDERSMAAPANDPDGITDEDIPF